MTQERGRFRDFKRFFKGRRGKGNEPLSGEDLRARIIEEARKAPDNIKALATARLDNPFFDTLPDQIRVAPIGVHIKILIRVPEGFGSTHPAFPIFDSINKAAEERMKSGNGPVQIKFLPEDPKPPYTQ
ncbi:hypothetical protein A3G67_01465 [Candidatus Roizmanbacteria bacterium RIFCSPLOWO2_12_FULL_40_12]|nr:MAG: hypothetical protein A3H84_02950 [Candidatus Roizmanbacteria bacterium RIFCSPLOWO2_02_FULL_40_13]OGK61157.1 MAG: hypothetical protein A3G67_01465 [Candidatus Roizmanbacteria bacterium RIFCSPLOWO2_12_FULL_40_12]